MNVSLKQKSLGWFLRRLAFPLGDLVLKQKMMQRLNFLEQAQWWPVERVEEHRNKLLSKVIQISGTEVPFYRSLWDSRETAWRDIGRPEDLLRLPVVTKSMMRPAYPHAITRNTGQNTYEACSSGSTGANFRVREDAETAGWYRSSFFLALQWAGWQFGEPHVQTGATLTRSPDKKMKDLLLQCHYVSALELSDASLDATLELIDRHSIRHLWGYPGSLHLLAQRAKATGWNRPLQSVVTWGDNLYQHYRQSMEQAFSTRVFDTYGCGEGMQIAAQCGHGNHYHIHSLDVVAEFVDGSGDPVPAGAPGNVVLTRLHPGPMPLIRYAIGDVGIGGQGKQCPCGRGFEIMQSVQGRDTDVVLTPNGNRLIVHFFTGILEYFRELECFQVVQKERDLLLVRVVMAEGSTFSREFENRIISNLQEKGVSGMQIVVEPVSEIPATRSGKRRFVISELPRVFG